MAHYSENTRTQNQAETTECVCTQSHTNRHKNTHTFVAEDSHFKCSSFLARTKKKQKTTWLVFWSASIFLFPGGRAFGGGRENAAQCSVATSAVCLMTFGRCRAHIHLCGRLSASFTDSASLTGPASRPQVWSLCGDRRCFSKTPGHVLRQSTLLLARYFKTQGFWLSAVGCVCVYKCACVCVPVCVRVDVGGLQLSETILFEPSKSDPS